MQEMPLCAKVISIPNSKNSIKNARKIKSEIRVTASRGSATTAGGHEHLTDVLASEEALEKAAPVGLDLGASGVDQLVDVGGVDLGLVVVEAERGVDAEKLIALLGGEVGNGNGSHLF